MVRLQKLIAAAALLDGRTTATPADLWPIVSAVPTAEHQLRAREALSKLLATTENRTLPGAAAEASGGPLARAMRVAEAGQGILAARPPDDADPLVLQGWHRRVEGIGREIDASFAPDRRPVALAELRAQVTTILAVAPA